MGDANHRHAGIGFNHHLKHFADHFGSNADVGSSNNRIFGSIHKDRQSPPFVVARPTIGPGIYALVLNLTRSKYPLRDYPPLGDYFFSTNRPSVIFSKLSNGEKIELLKNHANARSDLFKRFCFMV